jgi:hypothetical protein
MKGVAIILVIVVAVEVACDVTTIQKASHHRSRPVPGSCHYFGRKRDWKSNLFSTFIIDENVEMRVDNMHAELQILRLEQVHSRIQNPVVLLVKNSSCVHRWTREIRRCETRFWCVEIENPCVTSSDTANICCVRDTACPAKETIFFMCRHFSEKLFSCGHGVSSLKISLRRNLSEGLFVSEADTNTDANT